MKINIIITAGGTSQRYGVNNKLFEKCGTSCVLVEAIKPFLNIENVTRVIIGIETSFADELARELDLARLGDDKRIRFCAGGNTRTQTVKNALAATEDDADFIIVHDGARPYVKIETINAVIESAKKYGVALPLLGMTDSIVNVSDNHVVPVDRADFKRVQTPIAVKREIFEKAYNNVQSAFYDDLSAIKTCFSGEIGVVDGDAENIKITYASDLKKADFGYLTGCGYDVHRLCEGDGIKLLGVKIPCEYSFIAHSDGDVPIHALMDAILSALGQKDIGHLFPVDDPKYDDADSVELLLRVLAIARETGYCVHNVSVSIIAERPMLSPYIDKMQSVMANLLGIPRERIGVSATTNEKVGEIGDGQAIAAYATVLLRKCTSHT
ncbi:MAG: 2-C-methyl-D-erythritol 2,4-cyclodiphosphate synthase [Bacteroides sp.]|nr:2-C-methyl-D-erythritol 2,4-cyclodiphosphate synthase [Bacillota bacterium]MCM1393492.1 2-C-methyl-D-erythritol 2,4-cyclodiphosphate synthase [[Eubacterium] siraeum]MCM1456227.1 2-C-methyl-D-erythritol 2,4-cyclodiphosphate synthase [Bacteroides sp.]